MIICIQNCIFEWPANRLYKNGSPIKIGRILQGKHLDYNLLQTLSNIWRNRNNQPSECLKLLYLKVSISEFPGGGPPDPPLSGYNFCLCSSKVFSNATYFSKCAPQLRYGHGMPPIDAIYALSAVFLKSWFNPCYTDLRDANIWLRIG